MKLLVDMNLSPDWCPVLKRQGWTTAHWSAVGDPRAPDRAVMDWARTNGYVVLTHDLDFGALLATTRSTGPSVVQLRTRDVLPAGVETLLVAVLRAHQVALEHGALVSVDEARGRVRVLPLAG